MQTCLNSAPELKAHNLWVLLATVVKLCGKCATVLSLLSLLSSSFICHSFHIIFFTLCTSFFCTETRHCSHRAPALASVTHLGGAQKLQATRLTYTRLTNVTRICPKRGTPGICMQREERHMPQATFSYFVILRLFPL